MDAHLCSDAGKFLAALLLSLSSMLHLELPHINILSKADLVEAYGELHFNLEYYTEVRFFPHFNCPPSVIAMTLQVIAHTQCGWSASALKSSLQADPISHCSWHIARSNGILAGGMSGIPADRFFFLGNVAFEESDRLRPGRLAVQVQDLSQLVDTMGDDAFGRRYRKLSAALAEVRHLSGHDLFHSHLALSSTPLITTSCIVLGRKANMVGPEALKRGGASSCNHDVAMQEATGPVPQQCIHAVDIKPQWTIHKVH